MPTVADLLAAPGLDLAELVPAGPLPVQWVATSELAEPSAFLEGGEVLLTTGLGRGADADWAAYAAALASAGVVALGFGVGLSHAAVPGELVAAARGAGLGVFAVPRPTPFIAVTRAFVELLRAEEHDAAAAAVVDQRELAQAATRAGGAELIVRRLARAVGGEAFVVSPTGAVQLRSAPGAAVPVGLAAALVALGAQGLRGAFSEHRPDGELVIHPIGLRGRPGAYLVVRAPAPLGPGQRSTVATALALLGLDAETGATDRAHDRLMRSCGVSLLLRGQVAAGLRVLEVAARAPGGTGATGARLGPRLHVVQAAGRAEAVHDALSLMEAAGEALGASAVAAPDEQREGQLTVLVREGPVLARVEELLLSAGCRVGAGSSAPLAGAAASEATAHQALARASARQPVVRWDDVRAAGVGAVLDPAAARAFAGALVEPVLRGAGPQEGRALLVTARVFLAHHGAWQPTADALGLHRNTVRLRVGRLERLLGRSFDDVQLRTDLWVALQHVDDLG